MKSRIYCPILKWKAGEKVALEKLTPSQKSSIIPILELVDCGDPERIIGELNLTLKGQPAYLDTHYCDDNGSLLKSILELAREHDLNYFPVLYYDDLPEYADGLLYLAKRALFRIPVPEDIDGDNYDSIFKSLVDWKKERDTPIDIMLDVNFMDGKVQASTKLSELKTVIRSHVLNCDCIEYVIIASTSFPEDLSGLASGEDTFIERYEIKIFNKLFIEPEFSLIKDRLRMSDYGVTRFTDTDLDFSRMKYGILPKARYTLQDKYWILKGKKDRTTKIMIRGHKEIALEIYRSPYYYGESFSYGDLDLKERALGENGKGPGNNTSWVTIAANHHIVAVTDELSKLYEL
ncbi:hypothetical protein MHI27_03530 [Paenibacillus sp. FSL H8-0261]|uniref:beta family protein n=1 Tax=Paenibacillus sp. FSL H8-0261 TaxID=2921381 RepID=UPI003243412A